jgi:ketosteroid isomerase-like protein
MAKRPLADRLEVAAPGIAALAVRALGHAPEPIRRRVLENAFARAQAAFNRGDFEAIFALFSDDVRYVPPPALSEEVVSGREHVLAFWRAIATRFDSSTIENLSVEALAPERFVRTARLTHRRGDDELSYVIRQVTELRGGRVVAQVNEQLQTV